MEGYTRVDSGEISERQEALISLLDMVRLKYSECVASACHTECHCVTLDYMFVYE